MSDFLHPHCTICREYLIHISGHHTPAWDMVLAQCERLRAQRNEAVSTIEELEREKASLLESMNNWKNECIKLRLELCHSLQ